MRGVTLQCAALITRPPLAVAQALTPIHLARSEASLNLIYIAALLVVGVALGLLLVRVRKANRSSHARDGLTLFRETYAARYPDSLLQNAYLYLAERDAAAGPHYSVSPSDNLQQVYGLADLDLEDAVLVIADKAGAQLPTAHDLDALKTQVLTVDDMLRFLNPYFSTRPVTG
jgi:hypothetical protein